MAYRHIIISSKLKLSLRQGQLVLSADGEEQQRIPIEDIASLMLENHQISITNAALAALGEAGTVVFSCNSKHLPCAVMLPYQQHSRKLSVLTQQIALSEAAKNRLWKQIVQEKIRNQAYCLLRTKEQDHGLLALTDKVKKGDSSNVEATAAMLYFPILFGKGFYRHQENIINGALNYGYSILRGVLAQHIVNYGLEPALGLHHCNQLNGFNLADDLIEPYRPMVDYWVAKYCAEESLDQQLTAAMKRGLYKLLYQSVLMDDLQGTLYYAMECTVQSLLQCLKGERKKLRFPTLVFQSREGDDDAVNGVL